MTCLIRYLKHHYKVNNLTIGGRAGGHRPPNDGVGGTMHSGPPNSDISGPQQNILFSQTGAKFAGSIGHPMTKMLSASGGLRPPDPLTKGSAPGRLCLRG